jgi:hypothetical protein
MPTHAVPDFIPTYLYHYTSIYGVDGILKNKLVWASVLHFLNDSHEWKYALEITRQQLYRRNNERPGNRWPLLLSQLANALERVENLHICVFSLSGMPNQLSQWRGYCPPDGGYALRFNSEQLKSSYRLKDLSCAAASTTSKSRMLT